MKPLPITVIILAHRNDENLVKAIYSAQFAAEILIIDNSSGVNWTRFAELPLKVLPKNDPVTDFAEVRNKSLIQASHDWVFFLDSDEEVTPPVIPQLAALLASPTAKGGVVYRSDVFLGKKLSYGEAGHQQLLRIGKKDSMRFTGKVHEVATVTGELMYTSIGVMHYSHPSISEFISDVNRYAQQVAATKTTSMGRNLLELIFFPPGKLFYGLIIQAGIADGWRGMVYAACMSLHSLLVRIYRYEFLSNHQKHS